MKFYLVTTATPSVDTDSAKSAARAFATQLNLAAGQIAVVSDDQLKAFDLVSTVTVDALDAVALDPVTA